jgi:hypothetical protein
MEREIWVFIKLKETVKRGPKRSLEKVRIDCWTITKKREQWER